MEQVKPQVDTLIQAQSDLKEFMSENQEVFSMLKMKRKNIASLKKSVQNSMMENDLDMVESSSGTVIRLEGKSAVKHDMETLKRIAGEDLGEEYLNEVTVNSSKVRICSKKGGRKKARVVEDDDEDE